MDGLTKYSKKLIVVVALLVSVGTWAQVAVTLPENQNENETQVKVIKNTLEISWPLTNRQHCKLILDLEKDKPLFKRMAIGQPDSLREIVSQIDPVFIVNVGRRTLKPENGWTIFFDRVPTRSYKSYTLDFEKTDAKVVKNGARTMVSLGKITAPDFKGHLEITVYNGSPLFNIAAEITTQKDSVALLYDAGLTGETPWETVAFENNEGEFEEMGTGGSTITRDNAVKYRTIMGQNGSGAIAVFPPPHQYFYPLDEAYNLKSTWHGENYRNKVPKYGIGIRQEPEGDHRFVPWFNAPPGTPQRLNFFCLLGSEGAEQLLESVKKFTHNDQYVALDGYKTLSSHFHNEFIMNVVLADK
ncbi:MAG TPA: hypothetical protein VFM69_04990, partial [Pricia sp.]|nr:hypothetical protein [Pricia sp.]